MEIREATKEDIEYVAAHMRKSDEKEIWASHRVWPIEIPALCDGIDVYAVGNPAWCIFGCNSEGENGVPWLLATDCINFHSTGFLRASRRIKNDWLKKYGFLTNLIHADNDKCILWLQWLGFSFPSSTMLNGEKFLQFEMRCK